MAEACGVTPRALRLYQDEGILQPRFVDEESGYRSYSIGQAVKLDMITQLQSAGFTLREISDIHAQGSVSHLLECAGRRSEDAKRQIERLKGEVRAADEIARSCEQYLQRPMCGCVMLEYVPERRIVLLDPPRDTDLGGGGDYTMDERWAWYQQYVKRSLVERGYPLSLFRRVGCYVPKDEVAPKMDLLHSRPYVFVDESFGELYDGATVLKGGTCLTAYYDMCHDEEGHDYGESRQQELFDHLELGGFEIDGPFTYESIFRFLRLFNEDAHSYYRNCLPVRPRE